MAVNHSFSFSPLWGNISTDISGAGRVVADSAECTGNTHTSCLSDSRSFGSFKVSPTCQTCRVQLVCFQTHSLIASAPIMDIIRKVNVVESITEHI